MKFGTRVCLKPSNDRGEFELDLARSKNNIAENSFALGHETDNTCMYLILASACLQFYKSTAVSVSPIKLVKNGQISAMKLGTENSNCRVKAPCAALNM